MAKKSFTPRENKVSVEEDEAVETVPAAEAAVEEAEEQELPVEPAPLADQEVPAKPAPEANKKPVKVLKGKVFFSDGAGGRFRA